jgi:hypothetical protein
VALAGWHARRCQMVLGRSKPRVNR